MSWMNWCSCRCSRMSRTATSACGCRWTGPAWPARSPTALNGVIAANQTLGEELAQGQPRRRQGRQALPACGPARLGPGLVRERRLGQRPDRGSRAPDEEMQRVIGAVADGDLSKKITADVHGEMLELKNTINAMVDQLNRFISEVTRVAREVGTEGKLGQAAAVTIEVGGVWKDLTDNVNLMAGNLTGQVRDIAEVTTAVANGDLSKKITADVKGEFLELKNTVNAMVDQLNRFASEVTRVAREVGVEGKLGGQAQSAEVAGVWKDLTDNVNQLAANLTNQVRAIADVATAVTEGDLTRQVGVEASGEVAVLKDKLNEMIRNLRETTRENTEQDWLKTNLERFTRMLQGQRDLATVSNMILSELAPLVSAQHGVFYTLASLDDGGEPVLRYQAGYGYKERKHLANHFRARRGPRRPVRAGEGAHPADRRPRRLRQDQLGPRRVHAAEHHRAADPLRGLGPRRRRAGLVQPLQPDPPGVPRPADREHRAGAQHDRGQHPHREPAQAVPVPGPGAAVPPGGAAQLERGPGQAGRPPRRAEHRGRAQEPGGRARQAPGRGEGRAAGRLLEVQVGVLLEHVARAAHAAQQPADPRRRAGGQPRAEPDRRRRSSTPASSAPRATTCCACSTTSSTSRRSSRARSRSRSASSRSSSCRDAIERDFAHVAEQQGLAFSVELAPDLPASDRDRRRAGCARC